MNESGYFYMGIEVDIQRLEMCIHNVSDILSSLDENRRIIEKLLKQIDLSLIHI